jgi:hypothetical protein
MLMIVWRGSFRGSKVWKFIRQLIGLVDEDWQALRTNINFLPLEF